MQQKPKSIPLICHRCGRGDTSRINERTGKPEEPWLYRGKSTYYTSCPRCHTSVNIPNQHPELRQQQ